MRQPVSIKLSPRISSVEPARWYVYDSRSKRSFPARWASDAKQKADRMNAEYAKLDAMRNRQEAD